MSNNTFVPFWHKNEKDIVENYKLILNGLFGESEWDIIHEATKTSYCEKLETGKYFVKVSKKIAEKFKTPQWGAHEKIASFELQPMINCCGICVSTRAEVHLNYRGKGLGTLLNNLRIDIARHLGYGCLMCTDVENNTYQRKILAKNGWKDVHKFVNPRTLNTVFVSIVNL